MCTNPSHIRNRFSNTLHLRSEFGDVVEVPAHLYSHRQYIDVPCGKCAECRSKYIESLYQRAYVESLTSYVYFITLTYDNDHLPSVILPSGRLVYYAEYSHITSMFDRFRKNFTRNYRYLCVNEYGDTNNRPHFHILLFVAKHINDDKYTPYFLESFIRDNLGRYFSINIGTRKHPVYEKLFRFAYRYHGGVLYTNYFVKYVNPATSNVNYATFEHSSVMSKTIRYLISYANKGSKIDVIINDEINTISDDSIRQKYRNLLSTKVHFSKGFGNGFDENGERIEMPIISQRMSQLDYIYHTIHATYPLEYEVFQLMCPQEFKHLSLFVESPPYSKYDDVEEFTRLASPQDIMYHLLLLKYDPCTFNRLYRSYFIRTRPFISYFFTFINPSTYSKKHIHTALPLYSISYKYLRRCVDAGLQSCVPFISFVDFSTNTFYTLCDYYRQRCTTIADFENMLNACGFHNYDEWVENFTRYITTKKLDKAKGNLTLPTDFIQRNCFSKHTIQNVYLHFYA